MNIPSWVFFLVENEESRKLLFRRSRNVYHSLSIGMNVRRGGHCLLHTYLTFIFYSIGRWAVCECSSNAKFSEDRVECQFSVRTKKIIMLKICIESPTFYTAFYTDLSAVQAFILINERNRWSTKFEIFLFTNDVCGTSDGNNFPVFSICSKRALKFTLHRFT